MAGALAVEPAVGTIRLIALPIFAWLLVALAGIAMQFLSREPVVLGLLSVWVFYLGFKMFADPRNATLGLILLLVFAIVPQALIKGPELSGDLAYWFGMNFGIAALCEWVIRRLLPDATPIAMRTSSASTNAAVKQSPIRRPRRDSEDIVGDRHAAPPATKSTSLCRRAAP